jgi:hypothetical protein
MSSIPCSFRNWSESALYRTVADSYSQSDVDSAVSAKLDASAISDYTNTADLTNLLADKADASNVYTKVEVDNAVGAKANSSDVYSRSEIDTAIGAKADASDLTNLEGVVDGKANSADVYTQSQVDNALAQKADAVDCFLKNNADLIRLFECLRDSLNLLAPNGTDPFSFSGLIPV